MGEAHSKAHWAKDETAQGCKFCNKAFGFGRRRHHCRNCGYIFCGDCSFRTLPVPQRQILEPVRVCDDCYYALLGSGDAPPVVSQARLGGGTAAEKNNNSAGKGAGGDGSIRQAPAGGGASSTTTNGSVVQNSSNQTNTVAATGGATTPSGSGAMSSQAAANQTPAAAEVVQQPSKTQEQLRQERLKLAMQKIRQVAVYLEADTASVEPVAVDELPMWADQQDYTLSVTTTDSCVIPFPTGDPGNNYHLLLTDAPAAAKTTMTARPTQDWAEAAKMVMSVLIPY